MKYIGILFILLTSLYGFSYAKYNWKKKNQMAAIGMIIITVTSIVLPIVVYLSL